MCRAPPLVLIGLLSLAGCGEGKKETVAPAPQDAAIIDALADPILTDPDLSGQNDANAAIAVTGPASSALPPIDRSDDAVGTARNAAAALVGGAIASAPDPGKEDLKGLREAVTAAQMAMAARIVRGDCAAKAEYTARWAATLQGPLQVYPRGAVEEAAGTDAAGCAWRVVHFRTPVGADDVVGFYHARLRAAGYAAQHGADGEEHALRGRKGSSAYLVYVRKAGDGLTAVDVVTAG